MPYLTEMQLREAGFKSLASGVKISDRASIYDADRIEIGAYSRIDDFCVLSGELTIGRNVHITPQCLVAGGVPGVVMEDFSVLAYGVKVFAQSDDYSGETMTNSTIPKRYKNETMEAVIIRRHAIIGAGSIIMPGVEIAEGTSVGANSLILESTESWSVYAGSPAKKIKQRKKDLLALEKKYLKDDFI